MIEFDERTQQENNEPLYMCLHEGKRVADIYREDDEWLLYTLPRYSLQLQDVEQILTKMKELQGEKNV